MRKQYIFLALILFILYISYLIVNFKYKEYKINSSIDYIINLNKEIEKKIEFANEIINYKTSKAYKNKILKEQQWYKNKWENVVLLMPEERYNTFTKELNPLKDEIVEAVISEENSNLEEMTIPEKWIYFIFKKEIKL